MITQTKSVTVPMTDKFDVAIYDSCIAGCHVFWNGMHCRPMTITVANVMANSTATVAQSKVRILGCVPCMSRRTKRQTDVLARNVPMPFYISTRVVYIVISAIFGRTYSMCLPNPYLT